MMMVVGGGRKRKRKIDQIPQATEPSKQDVQGREREKCVEGRGRGVNSGGNGEEQCLLAIFMLSFF